MLTLTGAESNLLTLKSKEAGLTWYITPLNATIDYVDVSDSFNYWNLINPANGTDSGHNYNWFSGPDNTWDGSESTSWDNGDNWSAGHKPASGENVKIPNLANDPVLDTSVAVGAIGYLYIDSGAVLTVGTLTLNAADIVNSGTINVGSGVGGGGTIDAAGSIVAGNLTCDGATNIYVGGDWDSWGGTLTSSNSIVTFDGTDKYKYIKADADTLNDVIFNGSGSTWETMDSNLVIIGTLLVSAGTLQVGNSEVHRQLVTNDLTIDTNGAITMVGTNPSNSTIIFMGNWDSSLGTFNKDPSGYSGILYYADTDAAEKDITTKNGQNIGSLMLIRGILKVRSNITADQLVLRGDLLGTNPTFDAGSTTYNISSNSLSIFMGGTFYGPDAPASVTLNNLLIGTPLLGTPENVTVELGSANVSILGGLIDDLGALDISAPTVGKTTTFNAGSGNITVTRTDAYECYTNYSADGTLNIDWETSTLVLKSDTGQTLPSPDKNTYNSLTLNRYDTGTPTFTLAGNQTIEGSLTIGPGVTLDVSGSDFELFIGGNFSNSGTFEAQSGTLTFNGAAGTTQTISGTNEFYKVVLSDRASGTVSFTGGITINDSLNANGPGAYNVSLAAVEGPGTITLDATGAITLNGAIGANTRVGATSITGSSISIGGDIKTNNANLTLGSAVTMTASATLLAGTGTIRVSSSFNCGSYDTRFYSDGIDLAGSANSFSGTGTLVLGVQNPLTTTVGIGDGAPGDFNLTSAEIATLKAGFTKIIIGGSSDTNTINTVSFNNDIELQCGGDVTIGASQTISTNGNDLLIYGGTGTFTQSAGSSINAGSGRLLIKLDHIDLAGSVDSIIGNGSISLYASSILTSYGIGDGAPGTFNLTNAELATLKDGFSTISIGADGTGLMTSIQSHLMILCSLATPEPAVA